MGFIGNLFGGGSGMGYQVQSGLQPGQLEATYQQQQEALRRMQDFAAAVSPYGTQGLATQADVLKQQQALAGQLQQQAAGQGPSAAQAMLAQQTGNIAQQQAAMAASQRGASQNVGLVGRQAAMAGMGAQQQAAGQAATLRAQEQLSAIEQLRAQQMGMQQVAGQQVGQTTQALGGAGEAALRAQGQALQAQAAKEAAQAGIQQQTAAAQGKILGGVVSGVGAALGMSEGGEVPEPDIVEMLMQGNVMKSGGKVPGKAKVDGDSYTNDTVPALLSPGEIVVPRSAAKDPEKAAAFAKSVSMRGKRKK